MLRKERLVRADNLQLATETFGNAVGPPVILIMGAMASMLWWPDKLCERLAKQGRFVIRYDNRDTGLSTKYDVGEPSYTFDDMAEDAMRVLDAYGIGSAHLVGMSLGGMIGQLAALAYPSRVASLTAISTSPFGIDTSHLPQSTVPYKEHSEAGAKIDWSNREQVIEFAVKDAHMLAGSAYPFDEAAARAFIERDYDRSGGFLSATNHYLLKGGNQWRGRLSEIKVPLLVIHGTADPIFPIEHGLMLASLVAGARFLRIEGGGHELHKKNWDEIVDAIVAHTKAT